MIDYKFYGQKSEWMTIVIYNDQLVLSTEL